MNKNGNGEQNLTAIGEHFFALCWKYFSFDDQTRAIPTFDKTGDTYIIDIEDVSIEQDLIDAWLLEVVEVAKSEPWQHRSAIRPISSQIVRDAAHARIAARMFLANYSGEYEGYGSPELDVIAEAINSVAVMDEARSLIAEGALSP